MAASPGVAYFERRDAGPGVGRFRTTEHVGGAWRTDEQHIAPSFGLLTHEVEREHAARRAAAGLPALALTRLSHDVLGVVPMGEVSTRVRVLRPGRTIELVEAELVHAGRTIVLSRFWFAQAADTASLAGSALPAAPPPDELEPWDPTTVWDGGFIASVEVRRAEREPGAATFWVRTAHPLLDGEPVSDLARAAGLFDIANGMTVRTDPGRVAFPNLDLTAHLARAPHGPWVGFTTRVSFGPDGAGVTASAVHDLEGYYGTSVQTLTVRPVIEEPG